jgi:hypothetical protein
LKKEVVRRVLQRSRVLCALVLLPSWLVGCQPPDDRPEAGVGLDGAGIATFAAVARDEVVCGADRESLVGTCRLDEGPDGPVLLFVSDAGAIATVEQRIREHYSQRFGFLNLADVQGAYRFVLVGEFVSLESEPPPARESMDADLGTPHPIPIGSWVRHEAGDRGTIGCRVRDRKEPGVAFLLSADHVLVPEKARERGDRSIETYGPAADGNRAVIIGRVPDPAENAEPVSSSGTNLMDAAIAVTNRQDVGRQWPGGRTEPGLRAVSGRSNARAIKYGYGTRATSGVVRCSDATLCVKFRGRYTKFEKQIVIASESTRPFCAGGDSGALVMDDACAPMGILFARNHLEVRVGGDVERLVHACVASPIQEILDRFGVEIDPPVENRDLVCEPPDPPHDR